jgi:hypothetical protein
MRTRSSKCRVKSRPETWSKCFSIVLNVVGGEVTAKIGNKIAQELGKEIYGAFRKKIKAKEAASN